MKEVLRRGYYGWRRGGVVLSAGYSAGWSLAFWFQRNTPDGWPGRRSWWTLTLLIPTRGSASRSIKLDLWAPVEHSVPEHRPKVTA